MINTYVGLPAIIARVEAAAVTAVNEGANKLVSLAQDAAPVDEGTLAASIHTGGAKVRGRGATAVVSTGAEASGYAEAQEVGAAPHIIRAKNAQYLHFGDTFVKQVNHPGNPAVRYMEHSLLNFAPVFVSVVCAAMKRAL